MTNWQTVTSRLGRWGRNLFLLSGFAILVDVLRLLVLPAGAQAAFTDIFESIVVLFGAVASGWAARRSSTLVRALWSMTGLYLALSAAGDFHDFLVDLRVANAGVLSPLELLGWCTYLPLALMIFLPALDDRWLRWKWLPVIDFTQVAIVVGLAYVRFIYLHHVDLGEGWTHFGRVEVVRNILISSGLLLRAAAEPSKSARSVYRIVGGAFAAITVMKGIFPGGDQVVSVIGRPASLLAIGVLAACWSSRPDEQVAETPEPIKLRLALSIFAAATLITGLVLAHGAPDRYRWPTRIVVTITVLLFLARNFLADRTRFSVEAALRKSETDLTRAQAVGHIGSWRFDLQNNTLAFSDEACHIIGIPKGGSISPKQAADSLHPEDREVVQRACQAALREGTYDLEFRILLHGETRWVHILAEIEFDVAGRPLTAVGTVQDTSERRKAEAALCASEDRYRDLVDHSEDLVCTHDLQGNLLSVNPTPARLLGYTVEELLKIPMRDLIVPEGRPQFEEYLQRLRNTGQPEHGLLCVIARNGEIRTWEYHNTLRTDGVSEPIVRGMARDITEQRVAELALVGSEQRYRTLFEKSVAGVAIVTLDGHIVDCNDAWARMFGHERAKDCVGQSVLGCYVNLADRAPLIEKLKRDGAYYGQELEMQRADGSRVCFLVNGTLLPSEGGDPLIQTTLMDITARKRAEEALRASEQRLRLAQEVARIGTFDRNLSTGENRWTPEMELIYGLPPGTYPGNFEAFIELIHPEDRGRVSDLIRTSLETGKTEGEWRVPWPDGTVHWIAGRWQILKDPNGVPVRAIGMDYDITARKRAEDERAEAERRLQDLVANVEGIVWEADAEAFEFLFVSRQAERILGYPIEEWRQRGFWESHLHPDDREWATAYCREATRQGRAHDFEYRMIAKDGRAVWLHDVVNVTDKNGRGRRLRGIMVDITARKDAEHKLQRSEENYRNFVAQSSEGIFRQDLDAPIPIDLPEAELIERILHASYMAECNDAMAKMYGFESAHELLGKRLTEMLAPDDPHNIALAREYIRSGFRVLERESHEVDVHGNPKVFRNSLIGIVENGKLTRTWGIQRDVTEQVRLQESEHRAQALSALQKEVLELIARRRPLGESLDRLVCLIESQLPGLLASVVLLEDDGVHLRHGAGRSLPETFVKAIDGIAIGPVAGSCGTAIYRKETVIVSDVMADPLWESFREVAITNGIRACWSTPILSSEGNVLGSFAMYYREPRSPGETEMRLIHVATNLASIAIEREIAWESLRYSETELKQAQAVAQMGSWRYDLHKGTVTLSDELYRIIGRPVGTPIRPEEMMEILHPEDAARIRQAWAVAEQSGSYDQQCRIIVGGKTRWLHIQARIKSDDGKPVAAVGIAQDITERREAGEERRQSEERFRVALKDSPITVFNQDRERRYTWVYNTAFHPAESFLGKTPEEVIGEEFGAPLRKVEERVLTTGVGERTDVWFMHEGKKRHFEVTLEPLRDASGAIIGLTGASMNIARLRELADSLRDAQEKLVRERSYLEREIQTELGFEEVIGQSPNLKEVLKKTKLVAPTDSTVLLLGETGTGKELVARSVHAHSARCAKTFIKLNCAAVPSGLLESELFGHEKGAFTGAVSQKVGRIELADKGTLFLDEIGEMPLELQPKLLRVLQDREFERLGGVHTLHVDVRIIAATNRELQQDVEEKKFRQDLYYRLNVFPIELPPLRERRSDIPMLVEHFVQKHSKRMRKMIAEVPSETIEILQRWNWPGNIRELENMIERMVILSKEGLLATPPAELLGPQEVDDDSLHGIEREHLVRVLRDTYGVLSGPDGAASRLGMKRTTLQSMLKRFGIDAQQFRRGTGTFGA